MKFNKKCIVSFFIMICVVLVFSLKVYGVEIQETPYTEEYKKWLSLTDEEKKSTIAPRKYEVVNSKVYSLLKSAVPVKGATVSKYDLRETIPENVTIRNQMNTMECWAFTGIAVLESNLALKDKRDGKETVVYDYSERHLDYATSREFLNNKENEYGYRTLSDGGCYQDAESYLTNGSGAILEQDMPFENNEDKILLSDIQNKTVKTKVEDTVYFESAPNLDASSTEFKTWQKQIKEHIVTYGGVSTAFCSKNEYDIEEYGAYYCNNVDEQTDHMVTIIGWDDNYAVKNFNENCRPTHAGAWIVKNSWGDGSYSIDEWKVYMFGIYKDEFEKKGWSKASDMPDSFAIEQLKYNGYSYTSETGRYTKDEYKYDGYWYISYEDVLVNEYLYGIINSTTDVDYDNLYQHDILGGMSSIGISNSDTNKKVYLANVFNKNTKTIEKLNEISILTNNAYQCKVYVNPKNTSKSVNDLSAVELKGGMTEIIEPGYHTLKFKNPVDITGDSFVVVVEIDSIDGSNSRIYVPVENSEYSVANEGESYVASGDEFETNSWIDLGKKYSSNLCIKAFTTNGIESIRIKNNPSKIEYVEGSDFETSGMIVEAKINGEYKEITNYEVENGTNLKFGQTSVTIKYENKKVTVPIIVKKKVLSNIKITKEPTKKVYVVGSNFDKSGMEVKAIYNDNTEKVITTYTVQNGENLKLGQTYVTINYTESEVTKSEKQDIEVINKLTGKIYDIQNLNKVYDGRNVSTPTYNKVGDGRISVEWYKIDGENEIKLEEVPKNAGKYKVKVIMSESEIYMGASAEKEFIISKATYDMSKIKFEDVSYPYSGEERKIVINGNLPEGVSVRYENNIGINAGKYNAVAIFEGEYENYNEILNMEAVLTITKINPKYNVPSGLVAIEGQTLEDVKLPNGFSWEDDNTTSVGEIGENVFTVKYTPTDIVNYNIIIGIEVKVSVKSVTGNEIIINGYEVDEEKLIVNKILPNTKVEEIKEKIKNTEYKIINKKGEEVKDGEEIGTGYKIELKEGKQYTLIVYGDLNGDGKVNVIDIAKLQKILTKINETTEIISLAADLKEDKILNLNDLARLQKLATGQDIFK